MKQAYEQGIRQSAIIGKSDETLMLVQDTDVGHQKKNV